MNTEVTKMANKIISDRLKTARKMCGYSQKDVCKILDIKQSTFSSWERGISEPDSITLFKLCKLYTIENIAEYFTSENIDNYFKKNAESIIPKIENIIKIKAENEDEEKLIRDFRILDERGKSAVMNCINFELSMLKKSVKLNTYTNALTKPKYQYSLRKIPVFTQPAAAGLGNYLDGDDYKIFETEAPAIADVGIRISGDSMQPVINDGTIVWIKTCETIDYDEIGIFILNGNAYCKILKRNEKGIYLKSVNEAYSDIEIGEDDSLRVYGKVLI